MSQPMIVLYDVPSSTPQPWAPNVWRIRLLLNYKRLPYRTRWVEFPDVEKALRAINAPPSAVRADGRPVYTLPAILDPSHQPHPIALTQANTIAEYLEHTYPARPVIPEGTRALQSLFVHYVTDVFVQPLLPIMVPLSHQRLPARVQNHFRLGITGQADEDVVVGAQPARGRDEQWAAVESQFTFLAGILERNAGDGDGVVVTGHELTYADFALCSVLIWIERVAPHEGWARVREWNGGRWRKLRERCNPYMDVF